MVTINADVDDMQRFAKNVRKAPPELVKALKKAYRDAGQLVLADAAARTISKKVHATLRVNATTSQVSVAAGNAKSKLPTLLEGDGTPGTWKAPNFPPAGSQGQAAFIHGGHKQARQPYLHPALDAQIGNVKQLLGVALYETADKVLQG